MKDGTVFVTIEEWMFNTERCDGKMIEYITSDIRKMKDWKNRELYLRRNRRERSISRQRRNA